MQSRVPPNDFEAEQAVLNSMLFDSEALALSYESLSGDDFYRPNHKYIFESMIELYSKSTPVDLITLKNKLDEKGITEAVGGLEYLTELASGFSTSANIKHYLKIVKSKSTFRKLIKAGTDIAEMSFNANEDIDIVIDKAEKAVFNIVQNRDTEQFAHIKDVLVTALEKIEEIYKTKGKLTGVPTGFIDFDNKTAGLQPSDLILIAARPSMGKTAFALNIAHNAAVRHHIPTAVFSLEMSQEQLVNRILCAEALVDAQKLRTGALENDDWTKLALAMGPLSSAPLYIDDTPGISIIELRAKCRRLKMDKNVGLILIDYLQLMSGTGKPESRQQEISEISRSLKAIAREVEAPIVALSQLSRASETRTDHRPILSDLRESGAIEQDADVVAFLYRDEYYHPDSDKKNQAEVIIAKQRNGPTGTVDLLWRGQYTKFANLVIDNYSKVN